jgi:hypothetical protein
MKKVSEAYFVLFSACLVVSAMAYSFDTNFGTFETEALSSITLANGDSLIVGSTRDASSSTPMTAFLIRISDNGTLLWAKNYSGNPAPLVRLL